MPILTTLFPVLSRLGHRRHREHFFRTMIRDAMREPGEVDRLFGQHETWRRPSLEGVTIDGQSMIVRIETDFHDSIQQFWYSIWQCGDFIKIGVVLSGSLVHAPILEGQDEISRMFSDAPTEMQDRAGSVLYQWGWEVPGLYKDWGRQEHFIGLFRHLHFRICRIIHDGTMPQEGLM